MQVENLNYEQVKKARELFDSFGPPVTHKTYDMEDMDFSKRLTAIEKSLSDIKAKLEFVFGNHALIKGVFRDVEHEQRKAFRKTGFNHTR